MFPLQNSARKGLDMYNNQVFVFDEEVLQMPMPSQYR